MTMTTTRRMETTTMRPITDRPIASSSSLAVTATSVVVVVVDVGSGTFGTI